MSCLVLICSEAWSKAEEEVEEADRASVWPQRTTSCPETSDPTMEAEEAEA